MPYQVILLFIVAVINAVFSYFILRGPQSSTSRLFSLVTLSVSLWSINLAFFILNADLNNALFFANFYYLAAAAIPILFFFFSIFFLNENLKFTFRHYLLLTPFLALFLAILIDKNFLVGSIFNDVYGKNVHFTGLHYGYYIFYFIFYVVSAYYQLLKKFFLERTNIEIAQLRFIIVGTLVSFALGMYFNLILPAIGNYTYIWLGPPFSLIMVLAIGYAVAKHHLFDVRVIATEIFTFVIWFLILIRIVIAETIEDKIINGSLFIFSIIFGTLLIRTTIQEVRTRERIEGLAKDLAKANEHLRQMEEQKSEFVSIASHQLRTPLTAIKGYASMILEGSFGPLSNQARGAVEKLFKSSQRLVGLVEDFLTVSRIERGKMQFDFMIVDLVTLAGEVVENLNLDAKDKGLTLTLQVESTGTYHVRGDLLKLKQVLTNVIDNAIKYTNRGFVRVLLSRSFENKKLRIAVSDTGAGMGFNTILHLFKRFDEEISSNEGDKVGMSPGGLGLYVSYQITKAHGGTIWAESEGVGKGSTFFIELPEV